jgi:hypothetical protein
MNDVVRESVGAIHRDGPVPGSVWKHSKGGQYIVLTCALVESDLSPVVVYRKYPLADESFSHHYPIAWTRPLTEFLDGRFTQVPECEL